MDITYAAYKLINIKDIHDLEFFQQGNSLLISPTEALLPHCVFA
jgi:hypothetical protein